MIKAYNQNIVIDPWLSTMLGKEAYKIILDKYFMSALKKDGIKHVSFIFEEPGQPYFIFCKVTPLEIEYIRFLEKHSFNLVDTHITFEKSVVPSLKKISGYDIRFVRPEDEEMTVKLAETSFKYSRFHLDSRIDLETANRIKGEWVRNYFKKQRGDYMIVASEQDKIVGFLQLLHQADNILVIDLMAVDGNHRRRGIAGSIISFAEINCGPFDKIRVVTQVANLSSMRCYEDLGFRVTSVNYVFHYHSGMKDSWEA